MKSPIHILESDTADASPAKWYGLMFRAEMIRAIQNTRPGVWPAEPINPSLPWKWQSRRVIKHDRGADRIIWTDKGELYPPRKGDNAYVGWVAEVDGLHGLYLPIDCPHPVGTMLWVKENYYIDHVDYLKGKLPNIRPDEIDDGMIFYPADAIGRGRWCCQLIPECCCAEVGKPRMRSSMLMPRWASRDDLKVNRVRVERRDDISEADAIAEGFTSRQHFLDYVLQMKRHKVAENPLVFVYDFMRVK